MIDRDKIKKRTTAEPTESVLTQREACVACGAIGEHDCKINHVPVANPLYSARVAIARAADSRNGIHAGRIQLPEAISPYLGLNPETARALAEAFPAPNPDLVRARRLRRAKGHSKDGYFSVIMPLPREILLVAGMRLGDTVLISAWSEGIIRVCRVPEGPEDLSTEDLP